MKEWRYNGDNKDPQEDLGNDKMLVILWKALPDEEKGE